MSAPAPVVGTSDAPADTEAPSRRRQWRARAWEVLPPVVSYLVGHLLYTIAGWLVGEPYLPVDGRVRADSGLYALIASRGYDLFPCREDPALAPLFSPDAWCGSAGWFPLYPGLIKAITTITGLGEYEAGLLITEVCLLVTAALLWLLLRRAAVARGTALAVLALATVLPSGVYLHAVFPMSLAAALLLCCVLALHARRWALAGLLGAVVAAAYPVGILVAALGLGPVAVLWHRGELTWPRALRAALLACGLPLLGLAVVFGVYQLTVGHWDAYLMIQRHYGNGFHNPITSLWQLATQPAVIPIPEPRPELLWVLHVFTDAELYWSLGLVLLCVAATVLAARRRTLTPVDAGLALYALAMFVGPLVAGPGVSQYRSHTLLLPAVLLLRHLPARLVLWPYTDAAAAIALPMGTLFSTWLLF
ncbi:hypothetical protein [Catellatospora tritici]|uniref:hypothetical protein n=1 Tax=Catellatospora tritici TaxID=2851566 RepID=UPI001C2CDB0D|nr:hypothetical protein [Catellatospora tritici]MBV1848905.1 hypothetical protein [Catellatospora tritici]